MRLSRNKTGQNFAWEKVYPYLPFLIYGLVFCFFLVGLGGILLRSWDEAIYAQVAREMVERHDFLTPYFLHNPWFEKPPLYFWLTGGAYQIFGVSEVGARLVPALFGAGTVTIIFVLVRRHFGVLAGLLAAGVVTTTEFFYSLSRQGILDPLLTFFFVLTVYLDTLPRSTRNWLLIGAAFGAAILAKGAAAIIIPLYLLVSLVSKRQFWEELRQGRVWLGLLIAGVVALPWHLAMYWKHGEVFVNTYVKYHILQRASSVIENHPGGLGFHLETLSRAFSPWYLLLIPALAWILHQRNKQAGLSLILAASTVLLFYSLGVESKLSQYMLPAVPILGAVVGVYLASILHERQYSERADILLFAAIFSCLLTHNLFETTQYAARMGVVFTAIVVALLVARIWFVRSAQFSSVVVLGFCALMTVAYSATRVSVPESVVVEQFNRLHETQFSGYTAIVAGMVPEPAIRFYTWDSQPVFVNSADLIASVQNVSDREALVLYPVNEESRLVGCVVESHGVHNGFLTSLVTC